MGHRFSRGARGAIRPLLSCAAAACILVITLAPGGVIAQQPTFKTGTQVVSLFVTVADAQKRLGRKNPGKKVMTESPVIFLAFDLLVRPPTEEDFVVPHEEARNVRRRQS